MRAKKDKRYTPIGLDITASAIYAVQFVEQDGQLRLHAVTSRAIPRGEDGTGGASLVVAELKGLLSHHPFAGNQAVSAIPTGHVDVRPVQLPQGIGPDDGPRFDEAFKVEARSCLLYNPDEAVLDYLPVGGGAEGEKERCTLLLAAAKKYYVNNHLALLKAAGLECIHLEVGPCAVGRVLHEEKAVWAAIGLEPDHTTVSVARGPDLLFSRTIKTGSRVLIEQLSRALDVETHEAAFMLRNYGIDSTGVAGDDLEQTAETGLLTVAALPMAFFEICSQPLGQFVAELKRSFDYFSLQRHAGRVEKAYVLGPLLPPGVERFISDRLSMPVAVADPFARFSNAAEARPSNSSPFAVAAGLALRREHHGT